MFCVPQPVDFQFDLESQPDPEERQKGERIKQSTERWATGGWVLLCPTSGRHQDFHVARHRDQWARILRTPLQEAEGVLMRFHDEGLEHDSWIREFNLKSVLRDFRSSSGSQSPGLQPDPNDEAAAPPAGSIHRDRQHHLRHHRSHPPHNTNRVGLYSLVWGVAPRCGSQPGGL